MTSAGSLGCCWDDVLVVVIVLSFFVGGSACDDGDDDDSSRLDCWGCPVGPIPRVGDTSADDSMLLAVAVVDRTQRVGGRLAVVTKLGKI